MATMEGPLVLADISGYTKFIAATELEHSDVLVRRMLNTIVASLKGRLEPVQLEGDAVFFVGEGAPPELISWLEESYLTFHRRMRRILERRQCSCDACAVAPELTLKLIAHYGRYSRQRIGDTGQVHGLDVIVPDEDDRRVVHEIIYKELVLGQVRPESRQAYREIISRLIERGAQCIILGCTEIMLLVRQEDSAVPLFDTTTIHAVAAVDEALRSN